MYKFLTVLCIALAVESVHSAVYRQRPEPKPKEFASEEGCYSSKLNLVIPYSTSYPGPDCTQYNCEKDGSITIFTCGVIGVGPGCTKVEGDLSYDYPDCCPSVKCEDNEGPVECEDNEGTVSAVG